MSILLKRENGSILCTRFCNTKVEARASYLLDQLADEAHRAGLSTSPTLTTPYVNTISPERGERPKWDRDIEHRIRSIIRWNAVAIILRANKHSSELGGHIASFQSAATLYDIGFGHFWHAPTDKHGGDLIYIQGHSAPGIYARAFVEGRLTEEQLLNFRQETGRQRSFILSASLADAGFLAIPDRIDGPGPVDGDLPGAVPQVSARAGYRRHQVAQGLGVSRRRRDRRAGVTRCHLARRVANSSTI